MSILPEGFSFGLPDALAPIDSAVFQPGPDDRTGAILGNGQELARSVKLIKREYEALQFRNVRIVLELTTRSELYNYHLLNCTKKYNLSQCAIDFILTNQEIINTKFTY